MAAGCLAATDSEKAASPPTCPFDGWWVLPSSQDRQVALLLMELLAESSLQAALTSCK